jgi:hypothetical protein
MRTTAAKPRRCASASESAAAINPAASKLVGSTFSGLRGDSGHTSGRRGFGVRRARAWTAKSIPRSFFDKRKTRIETDA